MVQVQPRTWSPGLSPAVFSMAPQGQSGLGIDPDAAAAGIGIGALALYALIAAVPSYYVGKALAPNRESQSTYAWASVPAGMFLGPLGLGIVAAFALNAKK